MTNQPDDRWIDDAKLWLQAVSGVVPVWLSFIRASRRLAARERRVLARRTVLERNWQIVEGSPKKHRKLRREMRVIDLALIEMERELSQLRSELTEVREKLERKTVAIGRFFWLLMPWNYRSK